MLSEDPTDRPTAEAAYNRFKELYQNNHIEEDFLRNQTSVENKGWFTSSLFPYS